MRLRISLILVLLPLIALLLLPIAGAASEVQPSDLTEQSGGSSDGSTELSDTEEETLNEKCNCCCANQYSVSTLAEIDSGYGVGTSNVTIFDGIASKLPYGTHYVYFRQSQYEYVLAYSPDLVLNGKTFSAPSVTLLTYTTASGYNGQATFTQSADSNFSLNAGNYLVYSDLGNYPTLYERGAEDYAKTTCIILCSFMLYYLFHHLWGDIRQRYIDR